MSDALPTGFCFLALGALLALDHAAWPSLLLAQPIVSGALGGALLGHFEAGVAAGALVQMLHLGLTPVGGAALPEPWIGGLAAAVAAPADLVLRDLGWLDDARLAPAVVVGVGAAYAGRGLWLAQRALQARIGNRAHARLASGDAGAASRAVATGLLLHATRGIVAAALVLVLAAPLAAAVARVGITIPAGHIALALAAATLLRLGRRRDRPWLFVAGALVGGLIAWV